MADGAPTDSSETGPEYTELHRSSRDPDELRRRLEHWLTDHLPDPRVTELHATAANGMSSETILFSVERDGVEENLVARIAPGTTDVPVFPAYDMGRQFDVIRLVGEKTKVPVPRVLWNEPASDALGTPFFVMERVDGEVPPDLMPYNFGDSWLFDASAEDQRRLQDTSVGALAELHAAADAERTFAFLEFPDAGATHLRRHVAHARAWYEFSVADGRRSPTIEAGFAWLEDHWPRDVGPTVVSWGDSRIGNVMYRDFEPVAVLDWEMAGLGPREVDLGWMIYSHRAFEDIAGTYGFAGMPGFMRPDDAAATYERLSGHSPRDLDFYITYAAVQWGVVGMRTGRRQVHFGEREMPDDIDELMLNREPLQRLLAGTYWAGV